MQVGSARRREGPPVGAGKRSEYMSRDAREASGVYVEVWRFYSDVNPERSRFSGDAKNLALIRPRASGKFAPLHLGRLPSQDSISAKCR